MGGVRACDRKNCENIMCDNHIPNIGYMCYECEAEFVKNFSGNLTERAIKSALTTFMFSKKNYNKRESINDYLGQSKPS